MEVDLSLLERNLREVRRLAGPRKVIGAVKANGYGLGAVEITRALDDSGIDGVWTGSVEEALAVRASGIRATVIMFGGYLADQIGDLVENDLTPTVYDRAGLTAASDVGIRRGRPVGVFVKVDCGLRRLGVSTENAIQFARSVHASPSLRLEGIYTHLPFGDLEGREWARQHAVAFDGLLADLAHDGIAPPVTQLWGSSGLIAEMPDGSNTVCVGQLLYGFSPFAADDGSALAVTPVVKALTAKLIHVGRHPDGAEVAASPYVLGGAARTGVLAVGTGDGMRRAVTGESMHALIRGQRVPILGVSLEHTVVGLDGVDGAAPGDEVTLIGRSGAETLSLADWAAWFGCSQLDVAVTFLGRLPKRYVR
ncbi:alanine racemase [Mycolicibacterium murale]|uniref:alanine racemase n=1 Tax=Mycolicibacterium murale TaxID=182220 RepID=UPI001876FE2A|nr:alanine racemase [Mycolicibacterium murale]MCV7185915.1 alanine racemase [Mycolicibacterium murale]